MLQVGQLLTNLRDSSSNMLLPFTEQIMQLLQDDHQPAGERRLLSSCTCTSLLQKSRPILRLACRYFTRMAPPCPVKLAITLHHVLCLLLCIADTLTTEEIMPAAPEKSGAAFPGLKVGLHPA